MKVIFMGTPDFAIPSLEKLINSPHEVIAVYTRPPKPAGRGYELSKSEIHLLAEEFDIPVYTPQTLKNPVEQKAFQDLNADIAVVAAYGLLLPTEILAAPKYGCINLHPSDLPRWRGAAPLQHTILSGDTSTAICIMQMDEGMDTGDIIIKEQISLSVSITMKELHDNTALRGAELLLNALIAIESGSATITKQSMENITHARKLTKEDERIDWYQSAFSIYCQIKTFAPRPGAYFMYQKELIKIIEADFDDSPHNFPPGYVVDNNLSIACKHGFILPKLLQREGRKMIYTDAFLRGFNIPQGAILE